VAEIMQGDGVGRRVLDGLGAMVELALAEMTNPPKVDLAVAIGLPGVEIPRFAETNDADLVVIGRKRRTEMQRLLLGDTADSVARRSRIPCLFVVAGEQGLDRVLVGLDGSERGLSVLVAAMDFTRDLAAKLRVVTVEPAYEEEKAPDLLTGRSARLVQAVDALRNTSDLGRGSWGWDEHPGEPSPIAIHRGPIVEEIVREIRDSRADVLIVGTHRGGPAGVVEAGSIARRLAHEAPCAVLTIPL
jgi:nucleotide-binding universal stress UspA family protein